MLEGDEPRALYFLSSVEVLESAVEKDLVALVGLFVHCGVVDLSVGAVCSVNGDGACIVSYRHSAVLSVVDRNDGSADVVSFSSKISGLAAELKCLCDGDSIVFVFVSVILTVVGRLFGRLLRRLFGRLFCGLIRRSVGGGVLVVCAFVVGGGIARSKNAKYKREGEKKK